MRRSNFYFLLVFSLFVLAPAGASANVQITEVMYHPSGTQSGREWIEVQNNNSSSVDISTYKFFENNTNHTLSLLAGSGVLSPGSFAVIVEDQAKFSADYPSYSGPLLKASFSLADLGESLAIKQNSTAAPDDSLTYDPTIGADGDGNSLQKNSSSFVAATPTPGTAYTSNNSQNNSGGSSQTQSTSSVQTSQNTSSGGTSNGPPPITAEIESGSRVMTGGGSFFVGHSYGTEGLPLSSARYLWNFGDGAIDEGQKVFHTYAYPGSYVVVLTVANNYSTADDRLVVEVVPAQAALVVENDGSVVVTNKSKQDLDIGWWSISCGGQKFVIPEHTTLLALGGVRFATGVMKFLCTMDAQLLYPNGTVVGDTAPAPDSSVRGEPLSAAQVRALSVSTQTPLSPKVASLKPLTPEYAGEVSVKKSSLEAAVAENKSTEGVPSWALYSLGLVALIVLGVSAAWYARAAAGVGEMASETEVLAEEFDIDE